MSFLNKPQTIAIAVIALVILGLLILILSDNRESTVTENTDAHGHGGRAEDTHAEIPRGPQGGRLLEQDNFALELTLFESGVPPEYHVYAYADGEQLEPESMNLTITLHRLGGRTDRITFEPFQDYLRGQQIIVGAPGAVRSRASPESF